MIYQNGREVWNTGDNNIVYYNSTPYLDLLGCYSDPSLENNLPGVDFSIDYDKQELIALKLIFSQIAYAITMQKEHGHFILKVFDSIK